jgi:hypothetical protein
LIAESIEVHSFDIRRVESYSSRNHRLRRSPIGEPAPALFEFLETPFIFIGIISIFINISLQRLSFADSSIAKRASSLSSRAGNTCSHLFDRGKHNPIQR